MGEVCDEMRALGGKLTYLGMDCAPAKSTVDDALRDRDEELFRFFYFALIAYSSLFVGQPQKKYRKEGVSFDDLFAFDSNTITLFSDIMKGCGRNPKGEGKKKRGLKVHMLTDIHADTPQFVKISEAKMYDKNFLQYLNNKSPTTAQLSLSLKGGGRFLKMKNQTYTSYGLYLYRFQRLNFSPQKLSGVVIHPSSVI